jgi:hypothetical protein
MQFEDTYNIVTMVLPLGSFLADRTDVTRLQALDEPRNKPSLLLRWRDMATASSSVTLERRRDGLSIPREDVGSVLPVRVVDEVLAKKEVVREPVDAYTLDLE